MNAVTSANTLDWRASASLNPALAMPGADPERIYRFSSRCVLDRAFRRRVMRDPRAMFEEHGFGEVAPAANVRNLERRLQLGRRESRLLRAIASGTCLGKEAGKVAGRPVTNVLVATPISIYVIVLVILIVAGPPHQDQ